MPDRKLFEVVNKNINKYETRLENYIVPPLQTAKYSKCRNDELQSGIDQDIRENLNGAPTSRQLSVISKVDNKEQLSVEKFVQIKTEIAKRYAVFAEKQEAAQPKLCMWYYMPEADVQNLLDLTHKTKIRTVIDGRLALEYPKGISQILAIELLFSATRFCQKYTFNAAQTGTLLSIFYLTHHHFLSSFHTSAEATYQFFKEYMLLHCFESPPDSMQLFSYKESTLVAKYFCNLYLRNLPLIRLLTLPNFGFSLNYEKKPDLFEEMGKKKKGKDKKAKKEKKGGKKSKK